MFTTKTVSVGICGCNMQRVKILLYNKLMKQVNRIQMFNLYHMEMGDLNHILWNCQLDFKYRVNVVVVC